MKKYIFTLFILLVVFSHIALFLNYTIDNFIYNGIQYNTIDTNTYFSYMEQAQEGHLLFTNKYTSERVPYIIFNPVYLAIGWLTYLLESIVAYYLIKFAFLIIFVYLVYKLLKLVAKKNELDINTFFVLFGSGVGYLFILSSMPIAYNTEV